MSAIKLAVTLENESGVPVVPIFWAQSEDHDYEEISNTRFLTKEDELKSIRLDFNPTELGDSVGGLILNDAQVNKLKVELTDVYAGFESADPQFSNLINDSYRSGASLSKAFCKFIRSVFAGYGLIVFDPHTPQVKQLWRDGVTRALFETEAIDKLLLANEAKLKELSLATQVSIRSGSPLLFISDDGKRKRFTVGPDGFELSDKTISSKEMKQLVSTKPEVFTASALLRPIFQDFLLPTAAYVAGQAEFSYWAQIKGLYNHFGLTQPMVVPRASFIVSELRYERIKAKASVSIGDLELDTSELLKKRYRGGQFDSEKIFTPILNSLSESLRKLEPQFITLDPRLKDSIDKTVNAATGNIEKLKLNYERALLQREDTVAKQIEKLKRVYYPNGEFQERSLNFGQFLIKDGKAFLHKIYDEIEPFDPEMREVRI